ncbi:high affinity immunoglobulin gamma Fc receptor I-like [Stegastes partitus]|uniref:high affinity immunoglobulin gamma Fc receptor I-like n=1 Tax=Stegastes partitus TaxID=144197 RepID=UPI00049856AD|nr:PREDICTED: high affinity immunoglobulin gamma Fc receptor I-like [Stegastes partitus]
MCLYLEQEAVASVTHSECRCDAAPQFTSRSVSLCISSMEIAALCAVVASLTVLPDRSQFFQLESISLSCEQQGSSSGWTVMRNTSINVNQKCPTYGTEIPEFGCVIDDLFPSDSGVYWCESGAGECSDTVSITVTADSVILESPARPVMEGEAVTLRCRHKTSSSSSLTADFYKDELLIGSSSTGNFTITNVSKSDEGLYRCNMSGGGDSPSSWLLVREADDPPSPDYRLELLLLPVVGVFLFLILLMLLCLWRQHKGKVDPAVSYTDVSIMPPVKAHRIRDLDSGPTFYSTLNLDAI